MSTGVTSVNRRIPGGIIGDAGETQNFPSHTTPAPVNREQLRPEEEAISLPQQVAGAKSAIAPLNQLLGPMLTVANPVWTGDPVPRMRGLQKVLVEHSLTLDESDRSECMEAISVVENDVRLRLRLQQMRMNEADVQDNKPEGEAAQ